MGMWAVSAQIERTVEINGQSWASSRQVPTFYLSDAVQGITEEQHAVNVAHGVIDPLGEITAAGGILHITAVREPEAEAEAGA